MADEHGGRPTTPTVPPGTISGEDLEVLDRVQQRVLWLATSIVHYANHRRPNRSKIKVGGHQASSASVVSIMSALYFRHLDGVDRISVKPHASPVLHAINYLLGRLEPRYLTELRAYKGLQSYPSRTKDPDPVDFSTGSVGIGATASIWSALAQRYVASHFARPRRGRHVAVVGDAELDEGAVWEALVDPMVPQLGEVLWIVDVNRQSLDRVVPDIAAGRIGKMFDAAGWHTVTVKYGSRLRALFDRPGGDVLRTRIDRMGNEEYQHLLRTPEDSVRDGLAGEGRERKRLLDLVDDLDDAAVASALRDLGGHDLADLLAAFRAADETEDRPTVVFAYTLKGWRLPTLGHPANHSALLSEDQWRRLAGDLGADPDDPWRTFEASSPEAKLCSDAAARLRRPDLPSPSKVGLPADLGVRHRGSLSTQAAFGRFFLHLAQQAPEAAGRIVTVSPDVASSTNLGGWINRVGVWNPRQRTDWFADDRERLVRWSESQVGQHVELGIAETSLVGLLGELGSTWERDAEPLLPIGTVYDPFVARALEPWSFGIYAGGQSILVGTPSGVTLSFEGGAHQSIVTPSIGIEQPGCVFWEPAFAQDLEWCLLAALGRLGRPGGASAYFRLSTRPIDQSTSALPDDPSALEERRRDVLAGGYLLKAAADRPRVTLVGVGAVMPQVLSASAQLEDQGAPVDVVCLTSPDLVFRALQSRQGLSKGDSSILDRLFPEERCCPIVTVIDGHPHTLGFLAAIRGSRLAPLGVHDFGQVGELDEIYRWHGIDEETIVGTSWDLIEEVT